MGIYRLLVNTDLHTRIVLRRSQLAGHVRSMRRDIHLVPISDSESKALPGPCVHLRIHPEIYGVISEVP
jgi:hypothetical protein